MVSSSVFVLFRVCSVEGLCLCFLLPRVSSEPQKPKPVLLEGMSELRERGFSTLDAVARLSVVWCSAEGKRVVKPASYS